MVDGKGAELVVGAAAKYKFPLKVAGKGYSIGKLKKIAGKNVEFLGWVYDRRLPELYSGAKALIYASVDEDFGMIPVESMSYGVPVIAFKSGGIKKTVINNKVGITFTEHTPESLISAIRTFEKSNFKKTDLIRNANNFSESIFYNKVNSLINKSLKDSERNGLTKVYLDKLFQISFMDDIFFTNLLLGWMESNAKKVVMYTNVHNVILSHKDSSFKRIMRSADLIYPDGWGPVYASYIYRKGKERSRLNAADFIHSFLSEINFRKSRLYLLGDRLAVVKKAAQKIKAKYKKINLVGYSDGFFDDTESKRIVSKIVKSKPDLVLVGMGSPRQETWVYQNYHILPNSVYWCVGGLFNYLAGSKKRAPGYILKLKLEWLYRLLQEPERLWKRYTLENIQFLFFILNIWIKKNFRTNR